LDSAPREEHVSTVKSPLATYYLPTYLKFQLITLTKLDLLYAALLDHAAGWEANYVLLAALGRLRARFFHHAFTFKKVAIMTA